MEAGNVTLGALAPERDRTLVVLSRDGELAVGLRERLERARVVVKDARPGEASTAVASCQALSGRGAPTWVSPLDSATRMISVDMGPPIGRIQSV